MVAPDLWGQGIGGELMAAIEVSAPPGTIRLRPSRAISRRLAWVICGLRTFVSRLWTAIAIGEARSVQLRVTTTAAATKRDCASSKAQTKNVTKNTSDHGGLRSLSGRPEF
jgi:hypothetical protein